MHQYVERTSSGESVSTGTYAECCIKLGKLCAQENLSTEEIKINGKEYVVAYKGNRTLFNIQAYVRPQPFPAQRD